ncbi:hypothetical protein B4144_1808 [Bacillus atrophaeus]|nr:hypothetical protein B4144_1808 [Bacillus atrophaeus]
MNAGEMTHFVFTAKYHHKALHLISVNGPANPTSQCNHFLNPTII